MNRFAAIELTEILSAEVERATPFSIFTLCIFLTAICHTLLANHFTSLSQKVALTHQKKGKGGVSLLSEVLHFLGEVEVIFGLWVIPLLIGVTFFYGFDDVITYLGARTYVEPLFIVVIMSLCSTRPIVAIAEKGLLGIARLFRGGAKAEWLVILTISPILGSIITEVAAMAIAALLLKEHIYRHNPSRKLAYGTLGLLFVNLSVGAILTNFAAPPALTLARCWKWELGDFFSLFGWRILFGIGLVNLLYFLFLRRDLEALNAPVHRSSISGEAKIPIWVSASHLAFLLWTIAMSAYPPLFLGGYFLFLGFYQATRHHQWKLNLRSPLLVGLFLAGLEIHGGFQGWWIEPLLGDIGFGPLLLSSTFISAFNENTLVAHLACLLEKLPLSLKYAMASGLVAGGGLTVIAHAPNPVGQALLAPHFPKGVSPWHLFLSALGATLVFLAIFFFFPPTH